MTTNTRLELAVPEDLLHAFLGWFGKNCASGKAEVESFFSDGGTNTVTYRVMVSVRSDKQAELVKSTWPVTKSV